MAVETKGPNFAYNRAIILLQQASVVVSEILEIQELTPEARENIYKLVTGLRYSCGDAIMALNPSREAGVHLEIIRSDAKEEPVLQHPNSAVA